jgi:hypothetical protein
MKSTLFVWIQAVGFPLPTRGHPIFGLFSSYRPGKNEASVNSCYTKMISRKSALLQDNAQFK